MKFNKNQTLGFTSKLSDFEIINSEFTRCKCYMLAVGDNVNGSDITLDSVKKAMSRGEFYNKPIVAHLYKDEDTGKWRVGGHDSKWVITNTSIEIINECIPFGTIPESSNLQLEEVLEPDGETTNTYLTCQIILWTGRFNIMDAAYSDSIYFNQSCELSVNDYHWKENDVLAIDDFTFSALCLLNKSDDKSKNVRPCFPSCGVEKMQGFSIDADKFKQNFELMLDRLKQFEMESGCLIQNKSNNMKGVSKMKLNKFAEALSTITFKKDDVDVCKYKLINATETKVYALDMEDYKPYGFDYTLVSDEDDEKLAISYESKVEMSLSAIEKITEDDFEGFSIGNEINAITNKFTEEMEEKVNKRVTECTENLEKEFNQKMEEMKIAFDDLANSHKIALEKLSKYEEKEAAEKAKAHEDEINALFEKYSGKLSKCSEFLVYKAKVNPKDVTVDEVNEKLTLMVGRFMMDSQTKKNFAYEPTAVNVKKVDNKTEINKRYGNLLDKYINI